MVADERVGIARRIRSASSNQRPWERARPRSERGVGRRPASPSRRYATSHRSIVPRTKERSTPSGVTHEHAANPRTITPRSAGVNRGLTAAEITLKRNKATSSPRSLLPSPITYPSWQTVAGLRQPSIGIKRQTHTAAQSGSMLGDNRWPPTTAFANRHTEPTSPPKRRRAAAHAAMAAATATTSGRPESRGATSPTATQNRQNPTASSPARRANRRRQS